MRDNLIESLAEYVRNQPDFQEAQPAFVSIYNHERCYGGPEEGGWWYDVYQLEGSKAFQSREEAEAWLEKAKVEVERINRENAPARYRAMASLPDEDREPCPANCDEGYIPRDWSDGGTLLVVVEDKKGQMDNTHEPAPHYE